MSGDLQMNRVVTSGMEKLFRLIIMRIETQRQIRTGILRILEFSFSVGDRHSFKVLNRQFFVCASIILTAIYYVPPVYQQ